MQTGLAVTGTIFLPLQFLTGVFGMNFSTYGKDGEGYGTNGNPRYSRGLDLLNQPGGAIWFWVMCVCALLFQVGFVYWLLKTKQPTAQRRYVTRVNLRAEHGRGF